MSESPKDISSLSTAQRATLEKWLQKKRERAAAPAEAIAPRPDRDSLPLSSGQQRLWVIDQFEPLSPAYNIAFAARLSGPLDVSALERAMGEILRRHEVLRVRFETRKGAPVQTLSHDEPLQIEVTDLRETPEAARESEIQRLASIESRRPFDLARDRLFRVSLLKLCETDHVLLLSFHHIVFDGWSWSVFTKELDSLYDAFRKGRPSPLADLPIQYFDYAAWQERTARLDGLRKDLDFWSDCLKGELPVSTLPTDYPRPARLTYMGGRQPFVLPAAVTKGLRQLAQQESVSLFMTLLAAFSTLLHRYSAQDDILVGTPVANRPAVELESLIGFFVNTIVVRGDLSGDPTFREILARVRDASLDAYAHQNVPFDKLVETLQPTRQPNAHPIFQVVFAFQNTPQASLNLAGLTLTPLVVSSATSKFDLTLFMWEEDGALAGEIEYSADLFRPDTIERMVSHFSVLLEGVVAGPDRRLSSLPMLTEPERCRLLVEWNATDTPYPRDATIHAAFEEQVRARPNATAVVGAAERLSYGDLDRRANRLAWKLRSLGVQAGTPVGIFTDRSVEMVVGMVAILKAGGGYVPLDPAYPPDRLKFVIEDTACSAILTQAHRAASLPDLPFQALVLNDGWESDVPKNAAVTDSGADGSTLAYVIYTSGSTGKPKGVAVPHRGVLRLVLGATYARFGRDRVFLQLAPVSFDAATFEMWGALLHGAVCVLYPDHGVPDPEVLRGILRKHRVTTLWLTASLFNTFIDESPEALRGVDEILTGGEALSVAHIRRAIDLLPETQIINGYGPTENTTFTTCYPIPRKLDPTITSIPIGRPIANTQAYILDSKMQPVPTGVPGELYAGGDGLARGYLNREEATAQRFVRNPFSPDPSSRLYATGDLVRYLPDGNIEFLGRIDTQVKIRGFRIELGEIEAALARHPGVREVVVDVRQDVPGEKRLVAYMVVNESSPPSLNDLLDFIRRWLPDYMIPSGMVYLDSLPLTPNGKVDRRALPAVEQIRRTDLVAYEAPRNETERTIAEAWEEVLQIPKVGIHDNFFELGGHSLLATRVVARLKEAFRIDLPLRSLFDDPTAAGMARSIHYDKLLDVYRYRAKPSAEWKSLVPMQPQGNKPPFFLVAGAHANEDEFMRFLSSMIVHIGLDQPVYGFKPRGLDGKEDPHRSVEEMAEAYIEEMRAFQPRGPYLIGGECIGGIVAYEMAQQLEEQGQEVGLLFLMDTPRPSFLGGLQYRSYIIRVKLLRLYRLFLDLLRFDLRNIVAMFRRKRQRLLPTTDEERIQGRIQRVEEDYISTLSRYIAKPHPGKVTFLVSEELSFRSIEWRDLVKGGMEVHTVPGNHVTRLTIHGALTASTLTQCLDRARAESRA
ncbi:amino acid adenylation domain-containing protein [Candidatus Sumerlaeota bacterium]|nr:amino acid adenylation domain-containing protein [Candidatus Sumerlaeota bacterium]